MAWLTGWTRRRVKVVNGLTIPDYQMKLIVHKSGLGPDSSTDIYLGDHCRADFADLRFTDPDQTTLLSYWIESIASGVATVWIKIPTLTPINNIYIYYDNPIQTVGASDPNATFVLFDDFLGTSLDGTKWLQETGSSTVGGGYVRISGNSDTITSLLNFGPNIDIVFKTRSPIGPNNTKFSIGLINTYVSPPSNGSYYKIGCDRSCAWYTWNFFTYNNGAVSDLDMGNPSPANNVWETIEIARLPGSTAYYLNGVLKVTHTNVPSASIPFKMTTVWGGTGSYGNTQPNDLDIIRIRKYASPEPTFGVSGNEELNVTAIDMLLDKTSCIGPCAINAYVTWHNYGNTDITSFTTAVLIDDTTLAYGAPISILAGGDASSGAITTPILSIGSHTICPYPN